MHGGFRGSVGMEILWGFPQVFLWVRDGYGVWQPYLYLTYFLPSCPKTQVLKAKAKSNMI